MIRFWAVAKREFLAYFNSPVAYIVVSLFLLLVGTLFWITFFAPPTALTMRSFFNIASLVLVFYSPAVTMRLLAEERASGTLDIRTIHSSGVPPPRSSHTGAPRSPCTGVP